MSNRQRPTPEEIDRLNAMIGDIRTAQFNAAREMLSLIEADCFSEFRWQNKAKIDADIARWRSLFGQPASQPGGVDVNPMKLDEPPEEPMLCGLVADLERKHEQAMGLLGEIIATVTLPRNRERLEEVRQNTMDEAMMLHLLTEFDRWERAYTLLSGGGKPAPSA